VSGIVGPVAVLLNKTIKGIKWGKIVNPNTKISILVYGFVYTPRVFLTEIGILIYQLYRFHGDFRTTTITGKLGSQTYILPFVESRKTDEYTVRLWLRSDCWVRSCSHRHPSSVWRHTCTRFVQWTKQTWLQTLKVKNLSPSSMH